MTPRQKALLLVVPVTVGLLGTLGWYVVDRLLAPLGKAAPF